MNVSRSEQHSRTPSSAADLSGRLHVVWCDSPRDGARCEAIYYTSASEGVWTRPVDIVYSEGGQIAGPRVMCDDDAMLHLVWSESGIAYSGAPARDAGNARAWSPTEQLPGPGADGTDPDIVHDRSGALHVVFAVPTGMRAGIYHSRRAPEGQWTYPRPVYAGATSGAMYTSPRLAVGDDGRLHAVWVESSFPETSPPVGIRYSQSGAGGGEWSEPRPFDGPYDYPEISAVGSSEVHIVWSGTNPDRHKFHTWSSDEGLTWHRPGWTVEIGGFQGESELVVDSAGTVHLVQVAGPPEMLYYQAWAEGAWSDPVPLLARATGAPNHPVDATAAIVGGNRLAVLVSAMIREPSAAGQWTYEIMYLASTIGAASTVREDRAPTPGIAATQPTTGAAAVQTALTERPPRPPEYGPVERRERKLRGIDAVWLGVAPVLVLVALTAARRLLRRA